MSEPPASGQTSLGRRIAGCRNELGWTQQELAERVAISRVALSNLESGRSVPSERTIVLLAGVFNMEPHDLVRGSSYPPQKSDRLPLVAARYTEVDLELSLLDRDLEWLARSESAEAARLTIEEWRVRLERLAGSVLDRRCRDQVDEARRRVGRLMSGLSA
ncbi:MAG: helix-turn-helix transcriptional regulator [Microthrixaceae bacterium]